MENAVGFSVSAGPYATAGYTQSEPIQLRVGKTLRDIQQEQDEEAELAKKAARAACPQPLRKINPNVHLIST